MAVTPNALIIIDNSGSMLDEDVVGWADTRFAAAKDVITKLLNEPERIR